MLLVGVPKLETSSSFIKIRQFLKNERVCIRAISYSSDGYFKSIFNNDQVHCSSASLWGCYRHHINLIPISVSSVVFTQYH